MKKGIAILIAFVCLGVGFVFGTHHNRPRFKEGAVNYMLRNQATQAPPIAGVYRAMNAKLDGYMTTHPNQIVTETWEAYPYTPSGGGPQITRRFTVQYCTVDSSITIEINP